MFNRNATSLIDPCLCSLFLSLLRPRWSETSWVTAVEQTSLIPLEQIGSDGFHKQISVPPVVAQMPAIISNKVHVV